MARPAGDEEMRRNGGINLGVINEAILLKLVMLLNTLYLDVGRNALGHITDKLDKLFPDLLAPLGIVAILIKSKKRLALAKESLVTVIGGKFSFVDHNIRTLQGQRCL